MHINQLIERYGKDLQCIDLNGVRLFGMDILEYALLGLSVKNENHRDIIYTDLSDVKLPEDRELFQKILMKNLSHVNLPKEDYREYIFSNVLIENTIFHNETKLPEDKELFQKIKDKSLLNTTLPSGDFSEYNFKDVIFRGVELTPNTTLPNTKEFLQNVNSKTIRKLKIHSGNYDKWDFTGVDVYGVYFGGDVILPKDKNFLTKVKNSAINSCAFVNKDFSKHNFEDVYLAHCTFKNCKFPKNNWVKKLRYKSLSYCKFESCDLGGAVLSDSNIVGLKIDKCTELKENINIFQEVKNKNIENTILPIGDYSKHNFKDVRADYSKFPLDAILPIEYSFFAEMESCEYMSLTKNILKNIHLYNLNNVKLDLRPYKQFLTDTQIYLLRKKYTTKIENNEIII